MDLYKDIIIELLKQEEINIVFPNLQANINEMAEAVCYKTLKKIKTVIEDDSLADEECFMKIEEIVREFERIGSDGGNRHDFG